MLLRDRFLSTTSLLLLPPDDPKPGADGKPTTLNEDVGAEDDGGDQGDNNTEASGDDDSGEADGGADGGEDDGGNGSAASGDDDDEFADLPPEVKAKVQKRLQKEIGWRDRQIDKLTAKRRNAEADAEAARTIVERQPKPGAAKKAPAAGAVAEDDVEAAAARIVAQREYDANANAADAAGKSAYGDKWGTALGKLPKLGGIDLDSMMDILGTDHPEVVIYTLGNDPDEYERVMGLPPAKRRTAFAKIGAQEPPTKAAPGKRPSQATAPVTPINGSRGTAAQRVNLYDDKVDDDAWYAERNRTRRKKFTNVE